MSETTDEMILLRAGPACTSETDISHASENNASWAVKHPSRLLAFFCAVMFLVWFDNGLFASNGVTGCSKDCDEPVGFPTAQGDFDLSKFQLGVLAAMFMVGLMITSVCLTQIPQRLSPFRLIGVGMGIWVLAAIGSGASQGFWSLLIARMFVGAGEASIITLSAPFIDDVAPPSSVSLWFALLSIAPPIGVALGYIFGGIAESIGWRSCFFIEAAVGFVLVLVALLVPNVSLGSQAGSFKEGQAPCIGVDSHSPLQGNVQFLKSHFNVRVIAPCFWKENFPILSNPEDASAKTFSDSLVLQTKTGSRLWEGLKVLHRHPCFLLNTFGCVPIQATVGAFTFWGPKVGVELFHLSSDAANLSLGGTTIVFSLLGVLGGGALLDAIGATIKNALALQLGASLIGLVVCSLAMTLITSTFWLFCLIFGFGFCSLMAATAPLYAVGMWSIPSAQRPLGQAYLVVCMHALGDVPSPPLVGALQSRVQNWHYSLLAVILTLILSVLLYGWSLACSKDAPDYRDDLPEER